MLYDLKQAPLTWYQELGNHLISDDFTNSLADALLFILRSGHNFVYILIYVNNILITRNNNKLLQQTLDMFGTRFFVKDPTDLHYFLGIEAHRTASGLHLTQKKYILGLLTHCNMLNAKPVTTPMVTSPKLTLRSSSTLYDPIEYRATIESLQYLAFTRSHISYAVNRLSQFMHAPITDHWNATKWLLRYLVGTPSHGLYFRKDNPLLLHVFSDADWAGNSDDYTSTKANIIYLGKHPISWSSKKKKIVARSSMEAKYRSVANTFSEVCWICSLLNELWHYDTSRSSNLL